MTSQTQNQEQDQNISMNIEDATKLVIPEKVNVNYIFLTNINSILKVVAERGAFKVDEFYDIGTIYKELNSYLETRIEVKVKPSNSLENTQLNVDNSEVTNIDNSEVTNIDNSEVTNIDNSEVTNIDNSEVTNNVDNVDNEDNEQDIKIAL